jgi:hypothetical protein
MKCPDCRFDNRGGVKFCEECGAELELKCPNCKAKIPLGRKFCGEKVKKEYGWMPACSKRADPVEPQSARAQPAREVLSPAHAILHRFF